MTAELSDSSGARAPVSGPESRGTESGSAVSLLAYLPQVATGLALLLAFAISWFRAFQVDEVETIHAAFNLASGKLIYRDFWQGHNPLLYVGLSGILPTDDPALAFRISRLAMFFTMTSTVAVSGWLAHRLGGNAWLAMALLLLHTTFVERGMEVRPDTPMTLFLMLALLVGTSTRWTLLQRVSLQGCLLGLAFITTQKAAIACFALGCVWLFEALRHRDWKVVILPCLVWAIPFAGMLAILKWIGAYDDYVLYNLIHPLQSVGGTGAAVEASFSSFPLLLTEWRRNLPFVGAALFALAVAVRSVSKRDYAILPTSLVAVLWMAGLCLMAFPYPYSQVGGVPALAVLIAVAVPTYARSKFPDRGVAAARGALAAAILIAASMAFALPRLASEPSRPNYYQLHLIDRIHALTDVDDKVFDMVGLYFRDDAYPIYLMTAAHYARYKHGDYPPIAAWLEENGVSLFVMSYRIHWLEAKDRQFLQDHFVRVEANIWMSGNSLTDFAAGGEKEFLVTREGDYRYEGRGELRVNGRRFKEGVLPKGAHRLTSPTGIEAGRLVLASAPPLRSDLNRDLPLYFPFD